MTRQHKAVVSSAWTCSFLARLYLLLSDDHVLPALAAFRGQLEKPSFKVLATTLATFLSRDLKLLSMIMTYKFHLDITVLIIIPNIYQRSLRSKVIVRTPRQTRRHTRTLGRSLCLDH